VLCRSLAARDPHAVVLGQQQEGLDDDMITVMMMLMKPDVITKGLEGV
jgi:hypothetical protein